MKIINIDQNYIICLVASEDTYSMIPELLFLEKYKERFQQVKDGNVSCGSCTQNGLINPVSLEFIMFLFDSNNKNNTVLLNGIREWTRKYFSISEDFRLKFSYQEHSMSPIEDIFI
jgi:hypothetical protein